MATRRIVKGEDDILRKQSREVTVFDGRLHQLLDDMAETMDQVGGVGLAAVQIGVLRRAVVIRIEDGELIELVNPVITKVSEETVCTPEACLSFPGESGLVTRPKRVTVQAQNRHGDLITMSGEDFLARAFCHELDHLDGVVFVDIAERMLSPDEDYED